MNKPKQAPKDDIWRIVKSEDSEGLSRLFRCSELIKSVAVADAAIKVILDGGYEKSSMLFFNDYECSVSIHVAMDGVITDEYTNLATRIDMAVSNVR